MRPFPAILCFILCLVACGCGAAASPVAGIVEYKGQPLPSGTVAFFGDDNSVTRAAIGPEGRYAVEKLPIGKYRVSVTTPWIAPAVKRTPPPDAPKPPPVDPAFPPTMPVAPQPKSIAIPTKYNDPATSELVVDVVREMPAFDIKLAE